MQDSQPAALLRRLFDAALAAADPAKVVPKHLPEPPRRGRSIVIGAGKAAGAMAKAVEDHWRGGTPAPRRGARHPDIRIPPACHAATLW